MKIEHGAVNNLIYKLILFYWNQDKKTTQETTPIEVPNVEAITDGKMIYTLKQWPKIFQQYAKRKYKMDIADIVRVVQMIYEKWNEK